MYKIMLADDEGIVIDSLRFILSKEFGDTCVIESAKTGRSVIELAEHFGPDIAIMDIQMPGITGIEFAHTVSKRTLIIFTTAYTEYALDSYEVDAIDYLVKPIETERFQKAVQKALSYHSLLMKEEKEAKLAALSLAKELNNPSLIAEAYSELTHYYARTNDGDGSIPLFKTASMKGYSGSLQARLLFLLSEKYADKHMPDSARIYALQIPHLYQDSVDYLLGKIHSDLQQIDSARFYLNRSSQSNNPFICLKAYRQLTDLNIRTGSLNGVSDCLERLTHYQARL